LAVNPYTSQSISGYNASPPPDDGTQVPANKVEWAKHLTKIGNPLKTLAEGVNTQALASFNTLALEDWAVATTSATMAETDWHNGVLMTGGGNVNYPAPSGFENGWHNFVFNGGTTVVGLRATATDFFRALDGTVASGLDVDPGCGVKVFNTATVWLAIGPARRTTDNAQDHIATQMFWS
jgi:hypothetical protein